MLYKEILRRYVSITYEISKNFKYLPKNISFVSIVNRNYSKILLSNNPWDFWARVYPSQTNKNSRFPIEDPPKTLVYKKSMSRTNGPNQNHIDSHPGDVVNCANEFGN